VAAVSADGVIEGLELQARAANWLPFLLSVQFHPERLVDRYAEHQAIFRAFTQACVQSQKKNMKANILVVDDDNAIRGLLTEVLGATTTRSPRRRAPRPCRKPWRASSRTSWSWMFKLGQNRDEERAGLDLLPQIKKTLAGHGGHHAHRPGHGRDGDGSGPPRGLQFSVQAFETGKLLAM